MYEPPAPGPEASHGDVAYEKTDLNIRGVLMFGLALGVLAVIMHFGLALLFNVFRGDERAKQSPPSPLATERARLPIDIDKIPAPRLEKSQTANLEEVRRYEDGLLNSYGWIDREAGVIRIPIAEAMRLLANPKIAEGHGVRAKTTSGKAKEGPK